MFCSFSREHVELDIQDSYGFVLLQHAGKRYNAIISNLIIRDVQFSHRRIWRENLFSIWKLAGCIFYCKVVRFRTLARSPAAHLSRYRLLRSRTSPVKEPERMLSRIWLNSFSLNLRGLRRFTFAPSKPPGAESSGVSLDSVEVGSAAPDAPLFNGLGGDVALCWVANWIRS